LLPVCGKSPSCSVPVASGSLARVAGWSIGVASGR
jgi:hypothetical protein